MTQSQGQLKPYIARVAQGETLSEAESSEAFDIIMSGEATPSQIGGFLMALRVRGETVEEIAGAVRAMRSKATMIDAPPGAMDCCGTGGDGSGSLNVSTGVSLVLAGLGIPVAKHGNRALSSKAGAADVLAALGVNIDADMALVRESLWQGHLCFLMAPRHHSAMRHVGPTRVELGTRTIFNVLGPLCNPAGTRRQLVGVFSSQWVEPLANVLLKLGVERAWVVHGDGGLDELSTTGPSRVAEVRDGAIRTFEVAPADAGLAESGFEGLKGGDAATNAAAVRALLGGAPGPYRDIVVLNAAAGLIIADRAADLREGAALAAACLDNGKAAAALDRLVGITNRLAPSATADPKP
jgi:anthranilate phosphoribosyltransferase